MLKQQKDDDDDDYYYYKCSNFYGFVSVDKLKVMWKMTPNTFTSSINCRM